MRSKFVPIVLMITLVGILTGCGEEKENPLIEKIETEAQTEQTVEESAVSSVEESTETAESQNQDELIKITMQDSNYTDMGDGEFANIEMLDGEISVPQVEIVGNSEASDAINTYYKTIVDQLEATRQEYLGYAKDEYGFREEESRQYWVPYEIGIGYEKKRADAKCLSLLKNYYEFTGGAHPNSSMSADNFDTKTGKELSIADIFTDEAEGRSFVQDKIVSMIESEEFRQNTFGDSSMNMFFEDYMNYVDQIFTDKMWYFDEQGLQVICNEYLITPHVAGSFTFPIPYSELTMLKEEYK